jgi:hypothetical protein
MILKYFIFGSNLKNHLINTICYLKADYVRIILQTLRSKNEKFQLLSLSTFDSLLYDYQKVIKYKI